MSAGAPHATRAAAALLLSCALAAGAEEWRVSNSAPVTGVWQINEIKFFSDHACTKELQTIHGSAYATPLQQRGTPPTPEPLKHAGEDCWAHCGASPSGLCDWCGRGNACCRAKFPLDPLECHYAMSRPRADQHQCVTLLPAGQRFAQSSTVHAFDGKMDTAFEARCDHGVCPPGSIVLGVSIPKTSASVQCVLVYEPAPASPKETPRGHQVWLSRAKRPAQLCSGMCRSGEFIEGKIRRRSDDVQTSKSTPPGKFIEGRRRGVCTQFLSSNGQCSNTTGGVDCRGCRSVVNIWEAIPMPAAKSPVGPVPKRISHHHRIIVSMIRHNEKERPRPLPKPAGKVLRGTPSPTPVPVPAPSEEVEGDCWVPCQGRGGFCSYCGTGRACCRKGFDGDAAECQHAVGFLTDHHECVRIAAEHEGDQCLAQCDGKAGLCDYCGTGGACCKKGDAGDPAECRGAVGFLTQGSHHECVRAPVRHEGEDCWTECGGKSGECNWCGKGNACCKSGAKARMHHSEGGEDLDAPECRFAVGFMKEHHECVRLTHPVNNGSVCISADGHSAVSPPGDAQPGWYREEAEPDVQVHYSDAAAVPVEKEELRLAFQQAEGQPSNWPSASPPLWICACVLSALIGAAITVAAIELSGRRKSSRKSWQSPAKQPSAKVDSPLSSGTCSGELGPTLLGTGSRELSSFWAQGRPRGEGGADDKKKPC